MVLVLRSVWSVWHLQEAKGDTTHAMEFLLTLRFHLEGSGCICFCRGEKLLGTRDGETIWGFWLQDIA